MLNPETYQKALNHKDESMRCEALEALLVKGVPAAVELFIEAVSDESPKVRATAVAGLGRFGNPLALEALLEALDDSSARVRAEAAYALCSFRDERAIPGILAVLEKGEPVERVVALMGLLEFPHMAFAEALESALCSDEADVRNAAQAVLDRHVDFYHVRPLASEEPARSQDYLRWTAYEERFERLLDEDDGVERLLALLDAERSPEERVRMVQALAGLDRPSTLIPLVQCCDDSNAQVRCAALRKLSHWDEEAARQAIRRSLDDSSSDVRLEAVFAYTRAGAGALTESLLREKSERLVRMLITENCEKVREAALLKLSQLDYPRSRHFLYADLGSANKEIRLRSAVLLAEHGDALAREILWNALDDQDEWARALAAHGLGKLGDGTALERLLMALQDESADVRAAAAESLGELGDPLALSPLRAALYDVYPAVRSSVAESLARLEERLRGVAI